MNTKWLKNKISIDEAEREYLVEDELLGPEPVPFGFQFEEWSALKGQFQEEDELWEFSSPFETWENLGGTAGICIVRDGEVVDSIVTMMN